jgi:predicted aspartyl protease
MGNAIRSESNFSPQEGIEMGKVMVEIELVNPIDEGMHRLGHLKANEVRRIKLSALVDTGASLLSIPESDLQKLGLPVLREAVSRYANGQTAKRKIYGPAVVHVMGRNGSVSVLAGHPGMPALLGQLPLEELDFMVDPKRQRLVPGHPESPDVQLVEVY